MMPPAVVEKKEKNVRKLFLERIAAVLAAMPSPVLRAGCAIGCSLRKIYFLLPAPASRPGNVLKKKGLRFNLIGNEPLDPVHTCTAAGSINALNLQWLFNPGLAVSAGQGFWR